MEEEFDFMSDQFIEGSIKQESIKIPQVRGKKDSNSVLRTLRKNLKEAKRRKNWKKVSMLKKKIKALENQSYGKEDFSENKIVDSVGIQILNEMGFKNGTGFGENGISDPIGLDTRRLGKSVRRIGVGGFRSDKEIGKGRGEKKKIVDVSDFRSRMEKKYEEKADEDDEDDDYNPFGDET